MYRHVEPNVPNKRKDTLPFVIFESPFTSVSTVHYEYKADPMTSFEKDDWMAYRELCQAE